MVTTWQVDFLDRLVAASREAKDRRLSAARLHRRKQTASFSHPLVRSLECLFDTNRLSGNAQSQVLLIHCDLARGTHLDIAHLVVQLATCGLGGDARMDGGQLFVQHRWGYSTNCSRPRPARPAARALALERCLEDLLIEHCKSARLGRTAGASRPAGTVRRDRRARHSGPRPRHR